MVKRFEVHLVTLDPTVGSEMRKKRPCLVISPDEINRYSRVVIIAPLTSKLQPRPMRVACRFKGRSGAVVLDQIRSVDRSRLVKRLGVIDPGTAREVLAVLMEMFAP